MTKVIWSKRSLKQLRQIDSRYRDAIREKVNKLVCFPSVALDIKKMQGAGEKYRMRVGDYRVLFQIVKGEPVICNIEEIIRRTSKTY